MRNNMSKGDADGVNLTGVWQGLYTYPGINKSVAFVATLIETPGTLTGATHERCVFRDGAGGSLFATLLGGREGRRVMFRKTYDGAGPNYDLVDYEGTLSGDGIEIEGRWVIRRVWSGTFLMIREAGKAAARTRKVFVRA
jgi:hypothetical protein